MRPQHAIVLGGSVAGLCAAAALSRVADRVTLIERDAFPADVAPRRGVPQSRHVHALLQRGRDEMNALFPGFDEAMLARGVPELDYGLDFATLRPAGWADRMPTSIFGLYPSRDCVDAVLRALLARRPEVTIRDATRVTALLGEGSPVHAVVGVELETEGRSEMLRADLVVDAMGRGSPTSSWLEALGHAPPEVVRVDSRAAYASRWYRPGPSAAARWWKAVWIDPVPPDLRHGGVLFPVEADRWVVTLACYAGAPVPEDGEAFTRDLTERLRSPLIAECVADATPLTDVAHSRTTANQLRRWDRWGARLSGFVATGDAACAFNPVYGQGMSVAAACARLLRDELRRAPSLHVFGPRFHHAQGEMVRAVWEIATGADMLWPTSVGARPVSARLIGPFMAALGTAMLDDVALLRTVMRVFHLVEDASALYRPEVLFKVARAAVRTTLRPPAAPSPHPPALR